MHFYNLSVIKCVWPSLWRRKCKSEEKKTNMNKSLCILLLFNFNTWMCKTPLYQRFHLVVVERIIVLWYLIWKVIQSLWIFTHFTIWQAVLLFVEELHTLLSHRLLKLKSLTTTSKKLRNLSRDQGRIIQCKL